MALADRGPFGIPEGSTTSSPVFRAESLTMNGNLGSLNNELKPKFVKPLNDIKGNYSESDIKPLTPERSASPPELSPTTKNAYAELIDGSESQKKLNPTTIAPLSTTSLTSNSSRGSSPGLSTASFSSNNAKKAKGPGRVPIATGISKEIPVTGEKPRPDKKEDPSLEDDVLYAIFIILYEKDPQGKGMTVKQVCDVLVERHPQMAHLSTKTSNLVSAKLNAYVKRIEKGDNSLKYALSREWADSSPKRMVYVYRGLLTQDFYLHVKNLMESQKNQSAGTGENINSSTEEANVTDSGKQSPSVKPKKQATQETPNIKNPFLTTELEKSNLFVPYSSAPVTASLTETKGTMRKVMSNPESDLEFEDVGGFNELDDEMSNIDLDSDLSSKELLKLSGKRSKSVSSICSKKTKVITAAAAAPRAPKTCSHSPNAVAAAAALHAAALKAINSPSTTTSKAGGSDISRETMGVNKNWIDVVRSGFLTQDIGTPEDISLSDLDKLFT